MSLQDRLIKLIEELDVELNSDLHAHTSLLKSGLLDSLAVLNLALWIEKEIGTPVDPTAFDLSEEWDTISDILNFIDSHRVSKVPETKTAN